MTSNHRIFNTILGNSLVAGVTNSFVRFVLVFWAFLQTNSLIVSSLIGGFFAITNIFTAVNFGNIVDHHRKDSVMRRSTIGSLMAYILGGIVYISSDPISFTNASSWQLRVLIIILMSGAIIGNLRTIALSTTVSLLLPSDEHAKANGKIGMINGIGFTLTSAASGLAVGFLDMGWSITIAIVLLGLCLAHLMSFSIPEKEASSGLNSSETSEVTNNQDSSTITLEGQTSTESESPLSKKLNIRETLAIINEIPGLFALIFFTTFNNFLGGVFMALMDPYGLLLVSVQTWGLIFAGVSFAFIAAGLYISKKGLGKNPLKTIFIVNIIMWITCIYFVAQPSIWLLASGMLIWMFCSPFAEAAESTVLQKVVPYEKQGRVFGIAQSIESAAMPITTLLIGPITQRFFIPMMSEGGRGANLIGSWFGTGTGRGIAIVFILSGIIGLIITLLAYRSRYYKIIVDSYTNSKNKSSDTDHDITHPVEVGIG